MSDFEATWARSRDLVVVTEPSCPEQWPIRPFRPELYRAAKRVGDSRTLWQDLLAQAEKGSDSRTVCVEVKWGNSPSVGFVYGRIRWNEDDFRATECAGDSGLVLLIGNLVGHDNDPALGPLRRNEHGTLSDVDRPRSGFDHHNGDINRLIGKASERSDAGLEVGHDNRVIGRYGAEQLLSG